MSNLYQGHTLFLTIIKGAIKVRAWHATLGLPFARIKIKKTIEIYCRKADGQYLQPETHTFAIGLKTRNGWSIPKTAASLRKELEFRPVFASNIGTIRVWMLSTMESMYLLTSFFIPSTLPSFLIPTRIIPSAS